MRICLESLGRNFYANLREIRLKSIIQQVCHIVYGQLERRLNLLLDFNNGVNHSGVGAKEGLEISKPRIHKTELTRTDGS